LLGFGQQMSEYVVRAFGAFEFNDRIQRLQPFARFLGVDVLHAVCNVGGRHAIPLYLSKFRIIRP
jgi:hypothetical protein